MSDFGAVLEYAMALEASMPGGGPPKELAEARPAAMGPTRQQREELAKAAGLAAGQPATPAPAAADDKRK